jgi:phage terminase large subunit GpA-like protein
VRECRKGKVEAREDWSRVLAAVNQWMKHRSQGDMGSARMGWDGGVWCKAKYSTVVYGSGGGEGRRR